MFGDCDLELVVPVQAQVVPDDEIVPRLEEPQRMRFSWKSPWADFKLLLGPTLSQRASRICAYLCCVLVCVLAVPLALYIVVVLK
jgi:hypothetical protein